MPNRPCPSCGHDTPRLVNNVVAAHEVKYYRCDACAHVWAEFSDGRPPHHVTPLAKDRAEPQPSAHKVRR